MSQQSLIGGHIFRCALLVIPFLLGAPAALAATITVDSTADTDDAIPGDNICGSIAGTCTLRAAILEANANADSANSH